MVKAHEIRDKSKEELTTQLESLRNELSQLRVAKVTGGTPAKLAKIKDIRKSIARVLTVYNQSRKSAIRKDFANKKFKPLDLRPKLTRALRRRLTPAQEAAVSLRTRKRLANFPQRKYALKN
uniref:60S ribosomal protein L35 n=1 Tax=Arcella intermedia TaxID=1963864 RepID=A0A6B2LRS7_9EUKA|eukprot:TRINITY_DN1673_c0_g1_i1.p1 TRINITY_DN1673_c0_g1~~TRINITY_DN1673_c0_g1_i1.p1  ORF type:complete len:122 (-),score=23.41 TRINITY_DN1673_c0_g1_i1:112-477(-)